MAYFEKNFENYLLNLKVLTCLADPKHKSSGDSPYLLGMSVAVW